MEQTTNIIAINLQAADTLLLNQTQHDQGPDRGLPWTVGLISLRRHAVPHAAASHLPVYMPRDHMMHI